MSVLDPPTPIPHRWTTSRGEITFWVLPPNSMIVQLNGHLEVGASAPFIAAATRAVENEKVRYIFFDADKTTSYETKVRLDLTDWVKRMKPNIQPIEAFIRSKIVAMGATVASMALGGFVKVSASRSAFERSIERALKEG
jgi:hypothetical protein